MKQTNRYKDAKKTLEKAKELYQPKTTTVTCHSLGGSIGSGIASKKDKFLGFNAGYTIGQPTRGKHGMHQQYRTKGDLVSVLAANSRNIKNLEGPKIGLGDIIGGGLAGYTIRSHVDYN